MPKVLNERKINVGRDSVRDILPRMKDVKREEIRRSRSKTNTEDNANVPRKGWPYKQLEDNLHGFLSNDNNSYKRLGVKCPPWSPHSYLVEIRKYYKNKDKRSDEGVYLLEREYNNLVGILPYGRYKKRPYTFEDGDRTLITSPNKKIGGVDVMQRIKKTSYFEEEDVETFSEQRREVHLSRDDIVSLLAYGTLDNFVKGYRGKTNYISTDDDQSDDEADVEVKDSNGDNEPDRPRTVAPGSESESETE